MENKFFNSGRSWSIFGVTAIREILDTVQYNAEPKASSQRELKENMAATHNSFILFVIMCRFRFETFVGGFFSKKMSRAYSNKTHPL